MNSIGGLTKTLSCTGMNLYAWKWKQMNDIAGLSDGGLTSILSMLAFFIVCGGVLQNGVTVKFPFQGSILHPTGYTPQETMLQSSCIIYTTTKATNIINDIHCISLTILVVITKW